MQPQTPLTYRLRPKKVAHVLLPTRITEPFKEGVSQNYIFYGPPGTGKTSLTMALVQDFGYDLLLINASTMGKIEALRTQIADFCQTYSFESRGEKLILLDEFNGVSNAFQKGFKGFVEAFPTVRFVLTTNSLDEITPAIRSRFMMIDFTPRGVEEIAWWQNNFTRRLVQTAKFAKVDIAPEEIARLTGEFFPDMRSAINHIQAAQLRLAPPPSVQAEMEKLTQLLVDDVSHEELYAHLLSAHSGRVEETFTYLSRVWLVGLMAGISNREVDRMGPMVVVLARYQQQLSTVPDRFLSLWGACVEIKKILNC